MTRFALCVLAVSGIVSGPALGQTFPNRPIRMVGPFEPGGSMGTTGPASIARDGQAYGLRFPPITLADLVRAQSMLIEALDTLKGKRDRNPPKKHGNIPL